MRGEEEMQEGNYEEGKRNDSERLTMKEKWSDGYTIEWRKSKGTDIIIIAWSGDVTETRGWLSNKGACHEKVTDIWNLWGLKKWIAKWGVS